MPSDAELRALVERMVPCMRYWADQARSAADRDVILSFKRDLESLLRPQEPEQAARERLSVWYDPVANVWVGARGNERALSQGESPQGALASLLDAIDLLDAAERSRP